jgi:hypothetical protein
MKNLGIKIKNYPSNVEVYVDITDDEPSYLLNFDLNGYSKPSELPTVKEIWEEHKKIITQKQARDIKFNIRHFHFNW